ncbi:MAG: L-fucose/L-arabinose isomerase family protein [Planctomycetes bacterium]|nr:L-fucose/L-arabinose isomerase family protein [Planctomycetota bacterium]
MRSKVGIMTFLDSRDEMLMKRKAIVDAEEKGLTSALGGDLELISFEPIRTKEKVAEIARKMLLSEVDLIIMHLPIWASPNLLTMTVNYINSPIIIFGNMRPDSSSLVAVFAGSGSLDQIGIDHIRLVGNPDDIKIKGKILSVAKAASAIRRLKGQTFGYIGGRPLGMYTTTTDPAQWQRLFGVDIEHIDQFEIVRRAEEVKEDDVEKYLNWFKKNVGKIVYDENIFSEGKLRKQIRSYLGTKSIIAEHKLDFIGIKCQTELSDNYILQCIAIALLNDPYDADGPKEPIVCACEADADGALTMQILKMLSDGKPTSLMDVRAVDRESGIMTLGNCGGMPTYFTSYSDNPQKNLKDVHLKPHVFGKAGGGATQYICGPSKVTLARLMRKKGKYWMGIITGEFTSRPSDDLGGVISVFPHAFFRADLDYDEFLMTYSSNHIHAVEGNIIAELTEFCRLLNIDYKVYSN